MSGKYYDRESVIETEEKMNEKKEKKTCLVVKLTNYQGNDTSLTVDPDPLFMIVDAVTGEEVDNGYRSFKEAKDVWEDDCFQKFDSPYTIINEPT